MGVALMMRHPKVSAISCKRCQDVWHDEDWKPVRRGGKELPRPPGVNPPCNKCPKVPSAIRHDTSIEAGPQHAVEMSNKAFQAYMYYLEVKAGASMHNDPYTRLLCALIKNVEDEVEREQYEKMDTTPLTLSLLRMLSNG